MNIQYSIFSHLNIKYPGELTSNVCLRQFVTALEGPKGLYSLLRISYEKRFPTDLHFFLSLPGKHFAFRLHIKN